MQLGYFVLKAIRPQDVEKRRKRFFYKPPKGGGGIKHFGGIPELGCYGAGCSSRTSCLW